MFLMSVCFVVAGCSVQLAAAQSVAVIDGAEPVRVVTKIGPTPQLARKYDATEARFKADADLAALGRRIFFDTSLSQPQGSACASCHDPARAFASPLNARNSTGPGTPAGSRTGHFSGRNAPSLLYVRYIPRLHFYQDDDAPFAGPYGGLMADGRFDTLAQQIRGPLLDPDEMNNGSAMALMQRLRKLPLGQALASRFGAQVARDPEAMLQALGKSMQAFLQSEEMSPFSSRFDDYLLQGTPLSPAEKRGLALFKNPDKGNCASCHTLVDTASRPERSLFTDFGYDAIAVPRNLKLAANRDTKHFDRGLCATATSLGWDEPQQWCTYFRTPSLRNVAVKTSWMHNGVFKSLRDAVAFYNTRAIEPARWYAKGKLFDDVADEDRDNVNVNSTPMNRRTGMPPALTEAEIDDIVAFLRTLTDAPWVGLLPRQ